MLDNTVQDRTHTVLRVLANLMAGLAFPEDFFAVIGIAIGKRRN
jgi:hypothetical protein